jgi:hypothetical protein
MQDHFEKVAMDKALEAGGKKAFELLDESIQRFTESLRYSETGGKEIRSEIAGYRKGLLELFRAQILKAESIEPIPQADQPKVQPKSNQSKQLSELADAGDTFKKELSDAMEQLADSYIDARDAKSLVLSAAEAYAEKVRNTYVNS